MEDDSNKRNFSRKEIQVEVTVKDVAGIDGERKELTDFYFVTNNISAGGIYLSTEMPLIKGDIIELEFALPGDENVLTLQGKVMWINQDETAYLFMPKGVGIKFVNLTQEVKKHLGSYLNK